MKRLITAATLAIGLVSASAQALIVTTTGSIEVENGQFFYDQNGYSQGSIWDGVFGAEADTPVWFGSFDIASFGLDGAPPGFNQTASWTLGVEGEVAATTETPVGAMTVIDESDSIALPLGNFAMADQFSPNANIGDYDDIFNAFITLLAPNPAGPAPSIADIFNATNGITSEDLFALVSNILDPSEIGFLLPFAENSKIALAGQNTVVFISSNDPDLGLTNLSGTFSGSGFLQAQYVSAPAVFSILSLTLAGIFLRRKI